jgi:protease I
MNILMIIASKDFRDEEYNIPRAIFETEKITVITIADQKRAVGRFGLTISVDVLLQESEPIEFDAVFFVGGGGCLDYMQNESAKNIAVTALAQGKILSAICAAPRLLLHWGLLKNKKMTGWNGDDLLSRLAQKAGALYTGSAVQRDANVVTADGPESAREAAETIVRLLKKV